MQTLEYKKSLNWNVLLDNGKLLITKGGDEIYFIDELDEEKSKRVLKSYVDNNLNDSELLEDEEIQKVIQKFEKAGVIYKKVKDQNLKNLNIFIKWFSDKNEKINELLKYYLKSEDKINFVEKAEDADLIIFIRTNSQLVNLLKDYEKIEKPHLLIDIAYDHTISIGPLVFPQETSCLGCFVGRITKGWGDAVPPLKPNVIKKHELISALIIENIKKFQELESCPELIEQTWSFDLDIFNTKYDKIFRLPWCPICFPEKINEGTGSFELPWVNKNK